jgi:amidase
VAGVALAMLNTPDVRALWRMASPLMPADTRRFLADFYAASGEPDPAATVRSFVTRHTLLRAWGQFQVTHPLVVAPVCTDVRFEAGTDLGEGRVAETIRSMRMAIAINALGLPAVAVPVGIAGSPQAVQVIGARYCEDECLDAAAALEDRLGVLTPIDPR